MEKPESLRRVLLAHVEPIRKDPANLSLFVDKGRIAARASAKGGIAFEYRYTLNVVIQDYAGAVDQLMVPVLAWIAEAQPDLLLLPNSEPFVFESEILDGDAADVSIYIELTEAVLVAKKQGGGFTTSRVPEPGDMDAFPDTCCPLLRQLFANDDLAAESTDPDYLATL